MSTSPPRLDRGSARPAPASSGATLLISLAEIAALAKVQRPVVSMWRSRFNGGTTPFPLPVESAVGGDRFDAIEVAEWLRDTNHGNNSDAVADAAAFASVDSLPLTEPQNHDAIAALLALRAFDGRPLVEGALTSRAGVADPGDEILAREVMGVDTSWCSLADQMVDAAYSPLGAWERLHQRRSSPGRIGSAGSLSPEGARLITDLAQALVDVDRPMLVDAPEELSANDTLAAVIASFSEGAEVEVHVPAGDQGRSIRRELLVRGLFPLLSARAPAPSVPSVHLARLRGTAPAAELAQLEELVVELSDAQRAIVIGPDALLTERLLGTNEGSRDAVLRSGRVRGIVRLPQGLVPTAPRQSLAIWLIGGPQGGTPLADRFTLIGDLRGIPLSSARTRDVIGDLVTSLGTRRDVLAHSFRFLRFVRTSSLLVGDASLVEGSALPRLNPAVPLSVDLPVLLDDAAARLGLDLALRPITTPHQEAVPIGEAVEARDIRVLSGTRLSGDETADDEGFVILGQGELHNGSASARRIDRLRLAANYPRAEITRPGDVVFLSGARPRALVDVDGASAVEYPARILRLASRSFVPEIVASDINAQSGSIPWKRWMLRRIAPGQKDAVRQTLQRIGALRADAESRAAELAEVEALMIDAIAAGVVAPKALDETSESDSTKDSNTEGTN